MAKDKVLVVSYSDLKFDARVTRQLKWLEASYDVTCICFEANQEIKNVRWHLIDQTPLTLIRKLFLTLALLLRRYRLAYRLQYDYFKELKSFKDENFAWLIANDAESLPLVFDLKSAKSKVLFDAHEFAPRHLEERLWWRILFKPWHVNICQQYIPNVNQFCTVSNGLVDEYEHMFGVKPSLITNATKYFNLSPKAVSEPIKVIHHGIVNRSRKLELMMKAVALLGDKYQLDLILMLPESASESSRLYLDELKALANSQPNVRILDPMLNTEIVPFINQYDIGVFLLEPINFNYTFALPNKLFDFIQARLAIAIGPSIEMAKYVNAYDLGVVSESFEYEQFAETISSITAEKIKELKSNTHKVAMKLSEESNKEHFLHLLNSHV